MRIIITINEKKYKKAMMEGWNREYRENLKIEDFTTVDNKSDFMRAVPELVEEEFELTVIK